MEVAIEGGSFEKLQFKKCEDNYILDQHLRTCFSYLLLYIIKEYNYLYKIKYNIIQNSLKTCTSQSKYSNLYNHKTLPYSQKWDDNIIYDIISNSNYFCNNFELFNEQNYFTENIHSTNYTKIKCLSSSTNLKEQNKYEEIPSYILYDRAVIGGGLTVNHNLKNEFPQIWDGIKPFLSPNEYHNNKKKDTTIVSFNISKENQLLTTKNFEHIQNSKSIFIDNNKQANKMATIMHNSSHSYVCKNDLDTFDKAIYEQPPKNLQWNHNEILNYRIVKDGDSVSEYKTFNNIDNINRFSKSCEYRDNSNRNNDGGQDSSEKNESEGDKEKEINNNENSNNSEQNNSNNNQGQNNNQNYGGGGGEQNGENGEDEENNNNNGEDDKDKNDEDEEGENVKKEISEKEKYKFFYKKIKEIQSNIFVKRCKNVEKYFKKKIFNYINKNNIICNMNIDTIFIYLKNVYYLILNNKQLVFFFIYNTNDVMNAIINTEKCNEISYSEKDFFLYFLSNEKEIYKKIFDEINLKYDKNELILKLKKLKKRLNDLKHTEETNLFEESMKQLGLFKDVSKCVNSSSSPNCQSNVSNEDICKLFNYTNKRFLKNYKAVSHKLSLKNLLPKLYNCKDLKETNNLICNVGKNVKNVTKGGVGLDGKKKKKNKKNKEANMKKNNMNNSMINMNPYFNNFAKGTNMNPFMNNNIGNPQINNSFNYFRGFPNPQNNGFPNDNNFPRFYNNMQYAQHMQNNPNFKDNNLNDKDDNKNNETDEKGDENEVKKKTIRGITSFTLFAREKRKELLNQKVFLGSSLTEQTSAVAKIWNSLSDEKKKEWAVKASKINEENFLLQKKKKKRKFTAFSIFAREKRKEYKEKNIDMGLTLAQQNSYVSKLWKQLSTEEKNRYKYLSNTVNAAVAKNNKNQVNYINGQKVSGFKGRIKALDNMMSQHFSNNNNLMYNDMNNMSNFNNNNNNNNKMMFNQNQVMMGNEASSYNMNYMANMQNIPQSDNNMNYFNYMENMNKNMPMGYMNNDMNMMPDNGDDKGKKNSLKKNKKKKNENFNDPNQLMNNPNYMLKNPNSFNQQNYNSLPYHNDGLNNTNSYYPLPFPNDNNNEINNNTINNNSEMYRNIVINNNTQNMMTENNQNVMLNNMYDQNQISMNPNNIVNATTQMNTMKNNMAINPDVPIINNAKGEHNMPINQIDNNKLMQTHPNVYINNGLNNTNVNENSGMPNKINFPGHEHGDFGFNKFQNEPNEMYEGDNANIGGPPGSQTNMLMHNYQVMNGNNPQNGANIDDILKKKMMKDEKKKLKEEKMMLKEYDKRRKQMLKAEKLMEKNKNKPMVNGENNGMPIDSNSGYYDPANIMNNNNGNMAMYMNMNNYDVSNPLINNPMINNYNFYGNLDKQNINVVNNTSTTISPRNNTNNTTNSGVISAPTDEVNNDEFSNYTYANKFMTDSSGVVRNNNSIPNDSNIQISDDIKKYDHVINNGIHDNTKLGNHITDHQHIPNEQIQKAGINSSVINPNMPDNLNHSTYLNSNKDYFNNTSYFNNVMPNDQVMYQHTNGSPNVVNNGVPIKYLMENGGNPNKIYGYNNNNYLNNMNQNERTPNGISGGSPNNAGVIIKNDDYFNTMAREKDNNNDIKVDQNFNNTNYYQPNSTNTYINPNTNRNGNNVIVGSVNMNNNNNKMAHGPSSFSNDHVKNHNKINNSISYEVDDPNQGYANMNNPPVHLHASKQHNQSQYINLNETINNDINMGMNMEYNNRMNYININNDNNNNNKNNNPAYFYPHNRNTNIPNGENMMYFPEHVVPENKMPGNLVYFDTDMNRVPGAMEDIEISGHKGKQFFNNASHFLELVDKKRIKRKKKKSSVNNVNGDNDTIWDLVLKNKSKRERRKNKKSNELTIDNTLEDIINSDQNPNDDLNLLCLNNNGYYLNTDQDKQMEENNDINGLTNKERDDEDADKGNNENEDDILSLLNICMPNYSTKLNINERGEVTYDDKRTYNSNTIMNDNDNDFNFLMKTKNKVNENLNKCQIEKYNNAYKKAKLCKWSEQQTNKFYEVIEMFGVDLMMVRALLPSFTDKQIRDKYKKEKKNNPYRIDQALKKNKEIDLEAYENEHGKIDHSTHHNYYDSASDLDNSSPKKNNKDVDDSEINILSIFDNKDDDYNNNAKDQGEDKGITDFNILTLF